MVNSHCNTKRERYYVVPNILFSRDIDLENNC